MYMYAHTYAGMTRISAEEAKKMMKEEAYTKRKAFKHQGHTIYEWDQELEEVSTCACILVFLYSGSFYMCVRMHVRVDEFIRYLPTYSFIHVLIHVCVCIPLHTR